MLRASVGGDPRVELRRRSRDCWSTSPAGRRDADRPRPPRGERLRVRIPDGAHEPAAAPRARDGLPGAGGRPDLPELEPGARGRPLRRRRRRRWCTRWSPRRCTPRFADVSFRAELLDRARGAHGPGWSCRRGATPGCVAAADRLRREGIAEPIVLGAGAVEPTRDPRLGGDRRAAPRAAPRPGARRGATPSTWRRTRCASPPASSRSARPTACVAGATTPPADVLRAALWAIGTAPGVELAQLGVLHAAAATAGC